MVQVDELYGKIHSVSCGPIPLQCHHSVMILGLTLTSFVGLILTSKERAVPKFGTRDFFAGGLSFGTVVVFISAVICAAHRSFAALVVGVSFLGLGVGLLLFSIFGYLALGCMFDRKLPGKQDCCHFIWPESPWTNNKSRRRGDKQDGLRSMGDLYAWSPESPHVEALLSVGIFCYHCSRRGRSILNREGEMLRWY